MRKIEVKTWKAKAGSVEKDIDLVNLLLAMINNQKPDQIPKGLDKFRLFGRLGKAFDKTKETKILELEEGDYSFLKNMIEKDISGPWAMDPGALKAIELFMDTKPEKTG